MIHYHGTPCGATRKDVVQFLSGRHALIPWIRQEDIGAAAEVCQSFCLDNGAFSAWMDGKPILDWSGYYEWLDEWCLHPAFDFAVIPDVIDGTETDNDRLIGDFVQRFDKALTIGSPVWHMHESLGRLEGLVRFWPRVCLGSSGEYATVGTDKWWRRMREAMKIACYDDGRPRTKLHGLRMLDPSVFHMLPLSSADSTNAVRNSSNFSRFGNYKPPTASQRMTVIADRIESHQSPAIWQHKKSQQLWLLHPDGENAT